MVTLVGTESSFDDVVINLLELEYDASGAYELAIENLSDLECKSQLESFLSDHRRYIEDIKNYYSSKLDLPYSADLIKGIMAKMKVTLGKLTNSDINILRAVLDNEMDTNTAYERVVAHSELPSEMENIFNNAYLDEKKHKNWLEKYIAENK